MSNTPLYCSHLLQLIYHGGHCCGVKTIYGFDACDPRIRVQYKTDKAGRLVYPESIGGAVVPNPVSNFRIPVSNAPEESNAERFIRLIRHVQKNWPGQLIEVSVIAGYRGILSGRSQEGFWEPFFEAIGFKRVTEWENSNTQNTLASWHLVTNGEGVPKTDSEWNDVRQKLGMALIVKEMKKKEVDPFAALANEVAAAPSPAVEVAEDDGFHTDAPPPRRRVARSTRVRSESVAG